MIHVHISRYPAKVTSLHVYSLNTLISLRLTQSDQSLRWAHYGKFRAQHFFRRKIKTLIRLYVCADCFESSLYAHAKVASYAGCLLNYPD